MHSCQPSVPALAKLSSRWAALTLLMMFMMAATAEEARDQAVAALAQSVAGARVTLDSRLGVAAHIASPTGFLTGPGGAGLAVVKAFDPAAMAADRDHPVKAFLDQYPDLFGGGAAILTDADIARDHTDGHNGMRTVSWQQRLDGIAIHHALLIANLSRQGELIAIGSHFVPRLPALAAKLAGHDLLAKAPPQGASAALAAALLALDPKATTADIVELAAEVGAEQRLRLGAGAIRGTADAHLVWYARSATDLRLGWDLIFAQRGTSTTVEVVVDAQNLKVLYRVSLTSPGLFNPAVLRRPRPAAAAMVAAPPARRVGIPAAKTSGGTANVATTIKLNVWTDDSPTPFSPGWPSPNSAQPAAAPRTLVQLASVDATASPNGWIDTNLETRGNNVDAHTDLDGNDVADTPRPKATGTTPTFDFPIDLNQAPSTYRDATVTNLFYWCNVAHDRLYQFGFSETAGNFQNDNLGRGGVANDAVQADAQDGSGTNNANFSTPPDGMPGRMQMYIFTAPTPDRDGDLDATIILHEYTHGLSGRLVGGGVTGNLDALQSGGMGEGWSDFVALSLLSDPADDVNGTYAIGSYVAMDYYKGVRNFPYAVEPGAAVTGASRNPLTFHDINPGSGDTNASAEVHDQGEVWCMALWEARGEMVNKYGATAGNQLMLQLVIDALKLTPANPSFLDARDAILLADAVDHARANQSELWRAFAKRGLGYSAVAGSSQLTSAVGETFDRPGDLQVSPRSEQPLVGVGVPGGPFSPSSLGYTLFNGGAASLSWTASADQPWVTLSATGGTLAAGATATVTVSFSAAAGGLAEGIYNATVTFTNTTNGSGNQTRPVRVKALKNYQMSAATFAWIDPTSHAALTPLGDDDVSVVQTIPFAFSFYGAPYTQLYVGSNGLIGLGANTLIADSFANVSLPNHQLPNNLICPLWTDLDPSSVGSVRVGTTGSAPNRRYVISWVGVPHFLEFGANGFSFQAVLNETSNDILLQYKEIRPALATYGAGLPATVGIEDLDGDLAKQYSFNGQALLTNNQAILFHRTANTAPVVVTAAAVAPSPVIGTTATLSIFGGDDGGEAALTYTWATTGVPPAPVAFSSNGSNAAKNTIATFTKAGTYSFQVTLKDAGNLTATSAVAVTVNQTETVLAVSPATIAVPISGTQQFTATAKDQFGNALGAQPAITWSIATGVGSVSGSGLYTAPAATGTATVNAADGALNGTANITVDSPPTVATPAAIVPNPVIGTTATLSVLGSDNGGEGNLTYTWATTGAPPATVAFSGNGDNGAKTTTATFTKAGSYSVQVSIRDAGGLTVVSNLTFSVDQTATGIGITPATAAVVVGATRQFTAAVVDQFGDAMPSQPTFIWSMTPAVEGSVSASGLFTASTTIGAASVSAAGGGFSGSATVSVTAAAPSPPGGGGGGGGGCGLGSGGVVLIGLLLLALRARMLGQRNE